VINTYAEKLLTAVCYISCFWQIMGTIVICSWMLAKAPSYQSAEFVFFSTNNETGFPSIDFGYVALIGTLAAASVFTGYDTAAHVAEETVNSHESTPNAMLYSVYNAYILGIILIVTMNFCIPGHSGVSSVVSDDDDGETGLKQAYTNIWEGTVGTNTTVFFLIVVLVAIECSNCANLTSAARMVYSFSRDGALPLSNVWYNIDPKLGGPVRAIWLSILIAFLLGVPGVANTSVLNALFSLTATGLYASYFIPIFLRFTVARDTFQVEKEWNLGKYSIIVGWISCLWALFMVAVLCLPSDDPVTLSNLNYSGIVLGVVLAYALITWAFSARFWFKGIIPNTVEGEEHVAGPARQSSLQKDANNSLQNPLL
jgi:amino acid transporter